MRPVQLNGGSRAAVYIPKPIEAWSNMETSFNSAKVVSGSHSFTIAQYSLRRNGGNHYRSSNFKVGNRDWFIKVKIQQYGVHVLCELLPVGSAVVEAKCTFTLIDQNGNPHKGREYGTTGTYNKRQGWGYLYCLHKKKLETKLLNKDVDSFTIIGNVTMAQDGTTHKWPVSSSCTGLGQQLLQSCEETGDVEFNVQGQRFKAHKAVLATRSPVFRAQLSAADAIQEVDIQPRAFKAMLEFVYTGAFTVVDIPVAQGLLVAADKYGLARLKHSCVEFLCKNQSVETVASTLDMAHRHQIPHLMDTCLHLLRLSSPEDFGAVIQELLGN